jgi:hypothetical protein
MAPAYLLDITNADRTRTGGMTESLPFTAFKMISLNRGFVVVVLDLQVELPRDLGQGRVAMVALRHNPSGTLLAGE